MNKIKNNSSTILLFIVMLYMTIDLTSMVFTYKLIAIHSYIFASSSLIFPLTYSIMDVIAEVYGFNFAKKILIFGFACDIIFAVLVFFMSHIASANPIQSQVYLQVLGELPRAVIAQLLGVLSGAIINIYLISKWKIMTKGRYFWLRSVGSSSFGEAIMLIISVVIALAGVIEFKKILTLIIFTYFYKIIFAILIAPFLNIAVKLLKIKEEKPDYNFEFNPFHKLDKQNFSPTSQ